MLITFFLAALLAAAVPIIILTARRAASRVNKLAAIVNIADAGIVVGDIEGKIREWNIGAENILGYKPEEVIGQKSKYYTPDDQQAIIEEIEKLMANGEHFANKEVIRRHKDGRLIYCSASYTPIFDISGKFNGVVTVFNDITEKKHMEMVLEEAVKTAQDASKAKSMFLANMSHEIRTPLNGVIGFTELALEEGGISDTVKEYLNKIRNSADGLLEIVNDILDISKVESGKVELEKIPFDLPYILRTCRSIIEPKAAKKGIELHFSPAPCAGKILTGDPTKLRQSLLNLLSNAVKFTDYGTVKVTTAAKEETNGDVTVMFEVSDSGIGMDSGQIESIFTPFAQADAGTTRKYGGTGLGLSLTNSFVEMMGGSLSVESAPGLGSKFSFTLRFAATAVTNGDSVQDGAPAVLRKPFFTGEALICEDNGINQDVLINHLARVGLAPTVAENGKQGFDRAVERMKNGYPFDIIFMDIYMPLMDGLEATQKLIEAGNKTPIIALSANALKNDREKYLRHGMSDYLAKPFTSQELWECLLRHLTPVTGNTRDETGSEPDNKPLTVNNVIDENLGVERSSGHVRLYRRIQRNFVKDYRNIVNELNDAFNSGDVILAHRMTHSLKSAARTLGAENLARAAYDIELTFSSGDTVDIREQLITLESALIELLEILAPAAAEQEPVPEKSAAALDIHEATALADALSPLLERGSPESVDFIGKITTVFAPLGEICDELISRIDNYELEEARLILLDIKALLSKKQDC